MDRRQLIDGFHAIGARTRVQPMSWPAFAETARPVEIRAAQDAQGPYFDVRLHPHMPIQSVDVRVEGDPARLRLTFRSLGDAHRFECGRRGGEWFATAVEDGEAAGVA